MLPVVCTIGQSPNNPLSVVGIEIDNVVENLHSLRETFACTWEG